MNWLLTSSRITLVPLRLQTKQTPTPHTFHTGAESDHCEASPGHTPFFVAFCVFSVGVAMRSVFLLLAVFGLFTEKMLGSSQLLSSVDDLYLEGRTSGDLPIDDEDGDDDDEGSGSGSGDYGCGDWRQSSDRCSSCGEKKSYDFYEKFADVRIL
uniref:Uncharacterized protein n=1 Tax=Knipowitschia caucasica TaxID=637954 RepID=A0AAV2MGI6_KNICA